MPLLLDLAIVRPLVIPPIAILHNALRMATGHAVHPGNNFKYHMHKRTSLNTNHSDRDNDFELVQTCIH